MPPAKPAAASQVYLDECSRLRCHPDSAVLSALETKWHLLQVTPSQCGEGGCLLPLVKVLSSSDSSSHITSLKLLPAPALRQCRLDTQSGDVDARCLREILRTNTCITEVDFSHVGLGDAGVRELAHMLAETTTLVKLRVAHNPGIRRSFKKDMVRALQVNSSLEVLDISSNRLGHDTCQLLLHQAAQRQHHCQHECTSSHQRPLLRIITHGNNVIEETLNAASHGLGLALAVVAVIALLIKASNNTNHYLFASCLVYGLTLLAMFASSALFHSHFDSHVDMFEFTKMLDHSAIYLLIAGSMTPYVVVSGTPSALAVSAFQWACALFGIAFGMYAAHHDFKHKLKVEMIVNFAQGLSALLVYDDLASQVGMDQVNLLISSGACYVVGALFFVGEHTVHPVSHALWHVFVCFGAALHYFAVFKLVST